MLPPEQLQNGSPRRPQPCENAEDQRGRQVAWERSTVPRSAYATNGMTSSLQPGRFGRRWARLSGIRAGDGQGDVQGSEACGPQSVSCPGPAWRQQGLQLPSAPAAMMSARRWHRSPQAGPALLRRQAERAPGGRAPWPQTYLAADGLHPVQPVQGLLRVPQVLLQLGVQDTHGEGDHGACAKARVSAMAREHTPCPHMRASCADLPPAGTAGPPDTVKFSMVPAAECTWAKHVLACKHAPATGRPRGVSCSHEDCHTDETAGPPPTRASTAPCGLSEVLGPAGRVCQQVRVWGIRAGQGLSQRASGPGPEDALSQSMVCGHICAHACVFGARAVPQSCPSKRHGSIRAARHGDPAPSSTRQCPGGRGHCSSEENNFHLSRTWGHDVNILSEFNLNRCFLKEEM